MRWVPVVAGAGVLAGVVLGAALVAPAIAARDDATAKIVPRVFSCVTEATGELRIINADDTCAANEERLVWNQRGLPGPRGKQGPQGTQGAQGAQGPIGPSDGFSVALRDDTFSDAPVVLATLTLPAGTYLVDAAAYLSLEQSGGPFDTVSCGLDAPGETFATLTAFGQVTFPLAASVDIPEPGGAVTVECVKGQAGSVQATGTLNAVKVGALTLQ